MSVRRSAACAFVLALAIGACGPGQSAPPEPKIRLVHGRAVVESVDVVMDPSEPSRAQIVARGYLPDGCTGIDRVEVDSGGGNILAVATLTTARPADFACIQIIKSFEERIELDLAGTPEGAYVVEVNGVAHSFRIGSGIE